MLIKDKKIAIVGGGPGGLTLARLLQMKGADVKVYERDANRNVRVQGATLDLHLESGLRALEEAGLMDAFKANYRPGADKIRVVDEHANIFYDQHAEEGMEAFGEEWFRPEIDRGPLRELLLDSLQADTVVWDSHILSLEPIADTWKLVFQNGNIAIADIVIGADGANSKIRPFITPIKPFYSGITALEGNIYDSAKNTPKIHELLKGGKIFAFGDAKTLIVSAKGDGSLAFYTGCKLDAAWVKDSGIDFTDNKQVLEWFKNEYSAWSTIWQELFEYDKGYFIPRPLYCMPLDQSWETKANITMLGDAAHLMPPYAGEGVNMAMLDAVELSEALTGSAYPTIQSAIAHYEKQMCLRFAEVAQETLNNTDWMHSPNGLQIMLDMFNEIPS